MTAMAAVSVRTGPVSADDKARDVDRDRWIELTWARRAFVATNVPYDCRSLLAFVDEARSFRIWEQTGHADLEDYIRNGLEIDPRMVEWARIGLESLDRSKPQSLDAAVEQGKKTVAEMVAEMEPAKPHGGTGANQHTKDESRVENINSANGQPQPKKKRKGGTDPEYVIARLKRDANDGNTQAAALLGSLEAGEIKPYRAAVEMGWVKPPDPARIVEKQRERLEPAEQVRLWEQWGRTLPEGAVDRAAIAAEALLNCTEEEVTAAVEHALGTAAAAAVRKALEVSA